jgi:hypothetical protein
MKLTNEQLKQIIREELEVVLTNEEAGEIFGGAVQRQLEEDEASVEEGHCAAHGEEPPPREPADIVMALEKAMRALGDALDYMRAEHEGALGDVAGDMAGKAAMMNVGPMEEGSHDEAPFKRLKGMDAEREQAMRGLYFDDKGNKIEIIGKRVTQGGEKVDYRVRRMGDGAEATVTFLPDLKGNLKKLKFGSFGPPKEKKPRQFGDIYKGAQMAGREGPPIRNN